MGETHLRDPGDASGSALCVEGLVKVYDSGRTDVVAADGVTFTIGRGEFYTLLGESGCGKTTTLRCVAGLEQTDGGTIVLDGVPVSGGRPPVFVPAHRRDIGMVFQSYAIWPHMSVFDNVAFPLRRERPRPSRDAIRTRVAEALAAVRLESLEERMATQLSGGQQQRLALARAIVRRPRLLLLDEPLSNLDAKLREHMRSEIRALHARLGLSILYVTHDQIEALNMSSRIGVMSGGRIVQEGPPREIYQRPASRFVAEFVGRANFVECSLARVGGAASMTLRPDRGLGGVTELVSSAAVGSLREGDAVTLMVRPENVVVRPAGEGHDRTNVLRGRVREVSFLGDSLQCTIDAGGLRIAAVLHPTSPVVVDEDVDVVLPPERCTVLSRRVDAPAGAADAVDAGTTTEPKVAAPEGAAL